MFEEYQVRRNIGCLSPMPVIDNVAQQFYALAPKGVMLSLLPLGVERFTRAEVEALFAPIDEQLEHFIIRKVDLMQHSGVPLLLAVGMKGHDERLRYIEDKVGAPATSSLTGAVAAAKRLGIQNIAFANRFPEDLNQTLAGFFTREGIAVAGTEGIQANPRTHDVIKKISSLQHMNDAYALGRRALERFEAADGLYMGGGSAWLSPVVAQLEKDFGKPVVGHQDAMVWDVLNRVNYWKPVPGFGRLLASE